jgi:hypothetical protein
LCHNSAGARCGTLFVRELTRCVWKAASIVGWCSTTHWPCCSESSPMIVPSGALNVVGSCCVSHQIPCCLSSLKDTRLQSRSGQIATSCRAILVTPFGLFSLRIIEPYPFTHIFVFPAHMKSPCIGGRKFRMRSGSFVMWHVEPESRMNDRFKGYSLKVASNEAEMKVDSIAAISRPSSHSLSSTSGVGVCDFLICGVWDRTLLIPLSSP